MQTRLMEVAGWQTTISDTAFQLSPAIVKQSLTLVNAANAAFVHEDTAAWNLLGQPTAFGRLDFTVVGENGRRLITNPVNGRFPLMDGIVRPFEWEERPGGKGITAVVNPQFGAAFDDIRQDWPKIHVVISPNRRGYDDHLWAGEDNVSIGPHTPDNDTHVIVRAEPGETKYHKFARRSISTVTTKGDKSYGERLGWWKPVRKLDELPERGTDMVVLKPHQGSKTNGLLIAAPNARTRRQGMVTRTKLEEGFQEYVAHHGRMYLQPWYEPIQFGDDEKNNLILRVFFARRFSSPEWSCLGGVWNLRRNIIVHGATDTCFGPAILA